MPLHTKNVSSSPTALVLYHFLHPDDVVSAQHLTGLATGLAARGWLVSAACCNRACRDDSIRYEPQSYHDGIKITRLWRPAFRQGSGLGRVANMVWMLGAWALHALRRSTIPDVVIIGTDPPLSILLAPIVKRLWPHVKVAHWCFDLYPEAAIADGLLSDNITVGMLRRALKIAYGACDLIADIGPCMQARITQYCSAARITTLVPWALEEPSRPLPLCLKHRGSLFGDAPLALLYSGSLGRAHAVQPILSLARLLSQSGAHFAFTVRGNCVDGLRSQLCTSDSNITLGSFASPDQLRDRLAAPDIHIVTLKDEWTGTVVPSKFFGALAVGRPVLFVGSRDAAISKWIHNYGVGWAMDSSNLQEVAQSMHDLARSPATLQALFARCHDVYRRKFSEAVILDQWDAELRALLTVPLSEPVPVHTGSYRT